jgi:hypothetical protein
MMSLPAVGVFAVRMEKKKKIPNRGVVLASRSITSFSTSAQGDGRGLHGLVYVMSADMALRELSFDEIVALLLSWIIYNHHLFPERWKPEHWCGASHELGCCAGAIGSIRGWDRIDPGVACLWRMAMQNCCQDIYLAAKSGAQPLVNDVQVELPERDAGLGLTGHFRL